MIATPRSKIYADNAAAIRNPIEIHVSRALRRCTFISFRQRPHLKVLATTTDKTSPPGLRPEPWIGSRLQEMALQELKERMEKGPYGSPSEETLRWYLRDRSYDVEEAESKLSNMLKWRKDFQPGSITAEMVAKEYASEKAYVHPHKDIYGRPVIVIRTQKHITGQYPVNDSKRLCVFLIDQAISELNSSNSDHDVEQILGVFDLRGFSVPQNADFGFAKFMVEAFFEYYPKRVGQVLMVEAPWVFGPAWEVIRPLMRKYASLVRFVSVSELRNEFFSPETIPIEFR